MAIFGSKETLDERQERKDRELMEQYGLSNIDRRDINSIRKIMNDLLGNGMFKAGMALSFAKAEEQAKVTYLSALVEQNWIIIRQLDRLNKHFDDLGKSDLCSQEGHLCWVHISAILVRTF